MHRNLTIHRGSTWNRLACFMLLLLAIALPARADFSDPLDPLGTANGDGMPAASGVIVQALTLTETAQRGAPFVIAIVFEIPPGQHIYSLEKSKDYYPTAIKITGPAGVQVKPLVARPVHIEKSKVPDLLPDLPIWEGELAIFAQVTQSAGAANDAKTLPLSIKVDWMSCTNSNCFPEESKVLTVDVPLGDAAKPGASELQKRLLAEYEGLIAKPAPAAPVAEKVAKPTSKPAEFSFFGKKFTVESTPLILLLALAAGALLNFMPCVLPVIPLKVESLRRHAGHTGEIWMLGLSFSAGIIAFFLVIGLLSAVIKSGAGHLLPSTNQMYSYWQASLILGVVMLILTLSMFDVFTLRVPQKVYAFSPKQDTVSGSFFFGILTAVLSLPCVGPLLPGAIAWAQQQSAPMALLTFAMMGLGMALPYMLLLANPSWIRKMPAAGAGSAVFKNVIGLLLLAVTVYFLGLMGEQLEWWGLWYWWAIFAVVLIAMGWLIWRTFNLTSKLSWRMVMTAMALVIAVLSFNGAKAMTRPSAIPWTAYSDQVFDDAIKAGKTVMVEFTGPSCVNCRVIEATVFHDPAVIDRVTRPDVVTLKVNLTNPSHPGWRVLSSRYAANSIPFSAIHRPDLEKPETFPEIYDAPALLKALGPAK